MGDIRQSATILILVTSIPVINSNIEKILKQMLYICYLMFFNYYNVKILLDLGNKVNIIYFAYINKLDFSI